MGAICGIDWASEWHDVLVADSASGEPLAERRFDHTETGIAALIDLLIEQRVECVAIERPDGVLVGRLIFADVDSPIGLAFLARYPTPEDAHRLGPARLQSFLDRHRYCGRRTVEALLERLRTAPKAIVGETETEARRAAVLALVAALRPLVTQISQLTSQIRGAIHTHPDGPIFLSFFKDPKSAITAAGLLAEIGDNRARYPTAQALCADAGQAPVAIESGKHRHTAFRWACDKRLPNHVSILSDSTRKCHPWANDVYGRALARGQNHPHACRTLGRAWLLIL